MRQKLPIFVSLAALALAACGDTSDNSDPKMEPGGIVIVDQNGVPVDDAPTTNAMASDWSSDSGRETADGASAVQEDGDSAVTFRKTL
jgi:hypothetical protein